MYSKVHKTIGGIVRKHRIEAGLTQIELAEKLGYESPQFVSLFERGHSKIPVEALGRMVAVLKIPERQIQRLLVEEHEAVLIQQLKRGQAKQAKAPKQKRKESLISLAVKSKTQGTPLSSRPMRHQTPNHKY